MTSQTPAVASLAMLKVIWDRRHRDYLSSFVPFVVEAIRRRAMTVLAVGDLQRAVDEEFKLRIPQHALTAILKRARAEGYVVAEQHTYRPVATKIAASEFGRIQAAAVRSYEDIIEGLKNFVRESTDQTWTTKQAEDALLDRLRQRRFQLRTNGNGDVVTGADSGRGNRFLTAQYVARLREESSSLLDQIKPLAQGYMIANALYVPDLGTIQRRFHGTSVYLDTPLLIYALGFNGAAREEPALELLKLLYEVGANVKCYRHTLEELEGALRACSSHVKRGPGVALRGPALETVQYLVAAKVSSSDLELAIARLDRSLDALNVRVVQTPGHTQHEHVIDEKGLRDAITAVMTWYRENALERDVTSVAAVVRERAGHVPLRVEDSRAIFVTSNARLAQVVTQFFEEGKGTGVPPLITDYTLTTLLWLKRPTRAPELPVKRLIADCYAAIQPDEALWSAFEDDLDRLQQQGSASMDDVYDLRYSMTAKKELMGLTRGDAEIYSAGTALDVLAKVKAVREESARKEVAQQLETAESDRRRAEAVAQRRSEQLWLQRQSIDSRASRWARLVARVIGASAACVFALGAWEATPWGAGALGLRVVGVLGAVLVFLGGVWGFVTGGSLRTMSRTLDVWFQAKFKALLYRLADVPSEVEIDQLPDVRDDLAQTSD
ncbi:MAG TPA: hypothetical protein VF221_04530 [Chloroflexota bacterium]